MYEGQRFVWGRACSDVFYYQQLDMIAQLCEPNRTQVRDRLSGASESDRRLVLRRIEHARGALLLWEGASGWQFSEADPKHEVCDSGWLLIESAKAHSNDVCVVRHGSCLQIRAVNEAQLKPKDQQVAGIVKTISWSRVHSGRRDDPAHADTVSACDSCWRLSCCTSLVSMPVYLRHCYVCTICGFLFLFEGDMPIEWSSRWSREVRHRTQSRRLRMTCASRQCRSCTVSPLRSQWILSTSGFSFRF